MSIKGVLVGALFSCVVLLPGCGGAECDALDFVLGCASDDDEDAKPVDITIASPSLTGFYATSADHVRIAGTASEWDAEIEWTNDAGGTGQTSPEYELCFDCRYDWGVEVPLAVGYNVITLVATNDTGVSIQSITIRRQEVSAQWAWVR